MTRVIQWATGITEMMSRRHVIGRPDLELVGVRVYEPAKSVLYDLSTITTPQESSWQSASS